MVIGFSITSYCLLTTTKHLLGRVSEKELKTSLKPPGRRTHTWKPGILSVGYQKMSSCSIYIIHSINIHLYIYICVYIIIKNIVKSCLSDGNCLKTIQHYKVILWWKSRYSHLSKWPKCLLFHSPVCFPRYGECTFVECFFTWFQSVSCLRSYGQ